MSTPMSDVILGHFEKLYRRKTCSASAVAIHQACRAILSGECTSALAGGTMIMTSPLLFQNLAGASFLSPTGACKPFDAKADGYCRGEGIATVFLKKMSQAIADGDIIHGCIAATAVQQNENCTPIFVPNAPSLSKLFQNVTDKAGLKPQQISLIEAHGTGTVVGDPAEYESIKRVFGGPSTRSQALPIGSVKGLIGHTESVSGVIALIKILLMIQEAVIPPQASFESLNPHIKALPSDMMEVVTRLKPWNADFRAALINNYGASGSNASLVVTQPRKHEAAGASSIQTAKMKHPIWLAGLDERSLREYAVFNISRQSNRSLNKSLIFSCSSLEELEEHLSAASDAQSKVAIITKKPARPVILCFGGQISTFIGLDQNVYDNVAILRKHLDTYIFLREPTQDTVKLQTMLFALQYSIAKTWLDCGVEVAAIVGHSFGELTGLCISGMLSLESTIKAVAARAKLVKELWGTDSGSMMAVEADFDDVQKLLAEEANKSEMVHPATIACFNGPRSFTLAGSTKVIGSLLDVVATKSTYSLMKSKKLNVTNAFHSSLVDPLVAGLENLGRGLNFGDARIRFERATEFESDRPSSTFFAEHMRKPVYFNNAIQRLSKAHPSAIWLEAGSNSTITMIASRALGSPIHSHFQPVNITSDKGLQNLAEMNVALWKEGSDAQFWPHHNSQTYEYSPLILPPYQFEKSRHWLDLKKPLAAVAEPVVQPEKQDQDIPTGLYSFVGYQDSKQRSARFRINTMIKQYEQLVSGHLLAETAPICPATVEVDMAIEAILSLHPTFLEAKFQIQIKNVDNKAPICVDPSRSVWLDVVALDSKYHKWDWEITSTGTKSAGSTEHVSGHILFTAGNDPEIIADFAKYERLFEHQRCLNVLEDADADDIIQGRNIYKTFAPVVDYGDQYRGLQKLVGRGNMSAGRVLKKYSGETWLDAYLSDCFCQVGGIWVNCMTNLSSKDMYIANKIEHWIRAPKLGVQDLRPEVWDVFAYHHQPSDKAFVTDIFVFDSTNGALMEIILGINYAKVSKQSMSKMLRRLSPGIVSSQQAITTIHTTAGDGLAASPKSVPKKMSESPKKAKTKKQATKTQVPNISNDIRAMLAELVGLEAGDIEKDTNLPDIGIDSLMGMELAHEIEGRFKCLLPAEDLVEVTTMQDLVKCVLGALASTQNDENAKSSAEDEIDESEDSSSDNSDGESTREQSIDTPSEATTFSVQGKVDLVGYLAEFLGLDKNEVDYNTVLRDLGVDSLLSTELRADIAANFQLVIPEETEIEELTPRDLEGMVNGGGPEAAEIGSLSSKEKHKAGKKTTQESAIVEAGNGSGLEIPPATILAAFEETKKLTDQFIAKANFVDYLDIVNPKQTQMCVALIVEAFEQLGCSLRDVEAGQNIPRVEHIPQHGRLVEYLYMVLEKEARLLDIENGQITRTALPIASKSSKELLETLLNTHQEHIVANKLAYFTGTKLADVLTGKTDGVKVIFGDAEGRELVTGLYGDWPLNKTYYEQMGEFIKQLASKLPSDAGPLKILEMGAGTGGTTKVLIPILGKLDIPIEYTFTDLSMSFVAAARKKFKQYPFMKFRSHDIEQAPADDLLGTQHIIIASNAVHATHSLTQSTKNIHKALRPDGFLMMLEMTSTVVWIDIIFGLLEGWWLFDDGRRHAIAHQSRWEHDLQSVGFGHVDWTDGNNREVNIERIIIALASGQRYARSDVTPVATKIRETDFTARQAVIDRYVKTNVSGFKMASISAQAVQSTAKHRCVLITGATGSLGSHCVAYFANLEGVTKVVCVNRQSSGITPEARQLRALESRGIHLSSTELAKLSVFGTDCTKPYLGLPNDVYEELTGSVTHILHNAWPMSARRPVEGFMSQFRVMRNLVDFAAESSGKNLSKISFQFVSSIATVGRYPIWKSTVNVPEERMTVEAVLPNGYGDAKFVCERILDETLHKHDDHFRAMVVRPGQIAGSMESGYWNHQEHLPFILKSAQVLKAFPDFTGLMSWTPVDHVAATLDVIV
ncbi:putative Conidial yellow pigment biosynthesis polyketide synthase [Glarea lozoyensis 74030]|uniref:Putative Conidial yellow pigment biosynthesis polyketide synthase n=1 Tax=Glarea lozoyensis (strain ATCC 74030 / MF5533) TaxID=1104152 RepID=H0ESF4_GLAL7|nr:putative Conidial yellow pigment biosynthesis polyketide synthase [Glarea lozoyensis 74030]